MSHLNLWVIYDGPSDCPDQFVARLWVSDMNFPNGRPTDLVITSPDVETIRELLFSAGLVKLDRHSLDDPCILETWI